MGGFQTQVYSLQAPGIAGDFCDANPRSTFDAGPGGLVAGSQGLYVARFAWVTPPFDINGTHQVANSFGAGPVAGFVHREQQALITDFLASASMKVQPGFMVTLHITGGFWAANDGAGEALQGMKAYANYADGKVSFAASGSPGSASFTGGIAAGTAAVTGSISGALLNVSAVTSGTLYPGATIAGANVAAATKISRQVDGTPGGVGNYLVDTPDQNVASTAINATYGLLTVSAVASGVLGVGDPITNGAAASTTITALGTGTGGVGTYIVDQTQVVAGGTAMTVGTSVETKWFARSSGPAGSLIKMSSIPLG